MKKLDWAMSVAYWGVPVLATLFILAYWTLGLLNYAGPDIEAMTGRGNSKELMAKEQF